MRRRIDERLGKIKGKDEHLQFRHWLRFWGAGTGGYGKIVVVAITRVSYRAESGRRGKVVFEAGRIL